MVIFKELFFRKEFLSGSEAIVYSTLMHKSLWNYGEIFDHDGNYSEEFARDLLEEFSDRFLECAEYSATKLSQDTGISIRNVKYIISKLKKRKYLVDDDIYCPYWVISKGFIKLPNNTNLVGWQLVFYAMIKERCDYFGGSIDTYTSKLAEMYRMSEDNVRKYISILTNKGYMYRTGDGKLSIR